jgi:hypothetical protein
MLMLQNSYYNPMTNQKTELNIKSKTQIELSKNASKEL